MNNTRPVFFLLLLLFWAVLAPASRCAAASPVAWWKFDEGTGKTAADAAGNANTGTLQAGAGWAAGLVGPNALSVPGSSTGYVDIPKAVVNTAQSYTAMAWVKLNAVSGFQTVLSIDGAQVSGFYLQLRGDTGGFALAALPSDATGTATVAGSGAVTAGSWYHIAGVYDATGHTLSLYLNGTLQQTVSYTAAWQATGHTAVGRGLYGGSKTDFVNGLIDDARLYTSALTAADISAIAQANLPPAGLAINAATPVTTVSPTLYGLMTEEINHAYDGGLYAELVQNRTFQDSTTPVHWSLVQDGGGTGAMALDSTTPLSAALPVSLKLTVGAVGPSLRRVSPLAVPVRTLGTATAGGTATLDGTAATVDGPVLVPAATTAARVGVANDGFWGIPVRPNTTYRVSFYARASAGYAGPLTAGIESADGTTVYASAPIAGVGTSWAQYTVQLTTGSSISPSEATRFVISSQTVGTIWLNLVSLFPPTYNDRANGNRIDLMQKMADMKPSFLRLPGGNYLEGNTIATRFQWKNTVGPLINRPGHTGTWSYRSSDGLGLLEFLEWCEDLHMQPVLAVYAGYSLNNTHVTPGTALQPYVQDSLDEIQFVTGDASTPWGAVRAADGHPAPFPLTYIEVGNEDFFDNSGSYDARFTQFYDALKTAYPALQLIATTGVTSRTPDVYDEHYYTSAASFEGMAHKYDTYSRTGPKVFVGEWASQEGQPTPNMNSALGDAAFMTGMERNSDVVVLESYAPLLVNTNSGASQWGVNLIGYDALTSYGSPSYYAQKMFATYHGDVVLGATLTSTTGIFDSVTRDSVRGTITVKVVNTASSAQKLHVTLSGVSVVAPTGKAVTLSSAGPTDTNTLANPAKIVPVTSTVSGLGTAFDYTFAPYSITVLQVQAR